MQNKNRRQHQAPKKKEAMPCCLQISRSAAFPPGPERENARDRGTPPAYAGEPCGFHRHDVTCENSGDCRNNHPRSAIGHMGDMNPDPESIVSVAADYLATVTSNKAPKSQRHDNLYARRLFTGIDLDHPDPKKRKPPLLNKDLHVADVDGPVVYRLHRALQSTPVLANRILSFISQVCLHAERLGFRPPNSNPVQAIRRYRERERTEILDADQRKAFLDACWMAAQTGEATVSAACVCLLLILAGLRLHEATDLRWCEVDFRSGVIRLLPREERPSQTNKSGENKARPITDDVIVVLRAMPRWSEFVAPNPRTGRPYVDIRKPMEKICALAGLDPKTRRHCLRHAFGTALAEDGMTAEEISAWMGHVSSQSAEVYINLNHKHLRKQQGRVGATVRGDRKGPE